MNNPRKYKILIIENEMIIAADLSMQLTALGYQVIGIHIRAEEALKTIMRNRPDLILMDIDLAGEMDGIQAAAHILKTSKIPVVFLTSSNGFTSFERAIKTKPYAFITKPFQKSTIARGVKLALRQLEKERTANDLKTVDNLNSQLFIRQ